MSDLLLLIGICLVIGSFWYGRKHVDAELHTLNKVKKEVSQAKEDVNLLIKELNEVSEQVVENIAGKIKTLQESTTKELNAQKTPIAPIAPNEPKEVEEPPVAHTSILVHSGSEPSDKVQKVVSILESRNKEREREHYADIMRKPGRKKEINQSKEPQPTVNPNLAKSAKHQAVYSLAELGYSTEQIAKQMSIGVGEVALILQLKHKGEEVNGI